MEYLGSYTTPVMHEQIINTVIENSRSDFLEEGVAEEVLQELRKIWKRKISENDVLPSVPFVDTLSAVEVSKTSKRNLARSKQRVKFNKKCTTFQSPPSITHSKPTQFSNNTCSRSMPLLNEEDEVSPPFENNQIEITSRVTKPNHSVKQSLFSESKMQEIDIISSEEHRLVKYKDINKVCTVNLCPLEHDMALKPQHRELINKTCTVNPCLVEHDLAIKPQPGELNNNIVPKRRRKPVQKYVPTSIQTKKRQPRLLKSVLKNNNAKQTKQATGVQKNAKTAVNKHYLTLVRTDGRLSNPKFNIKPKATGISINAKQERLEESELNTDDDATDACDSSEVFECDNTVICQYEKIKKIKNKWNINLKCGIMHLKGKDYVFNSASCDVKW